MELTIENTHIDTQEITNLYPIAIVKTGDANETTPISLEWLEHESKGRVVVAGFAIVVQYKNGEKKEFFYPSREQLDIAIESISSQLR